MKDRKQHSKKLQRNIVAVLVIFFIISNVIASEKPRIAILQLERENVTDLEASIVEHFLRSSFVNAGMYQVLDRNNMDKILKEQSMNGYGILSERDVAQMGRILNVQQIVTGSLMKLNSEFLIEVRLVDVETSSIHCSRTGTCSNNRQLPVMARRMVEKISGVSISVGMEDSIREEAETPSEEDESLDYYTVDASGTITNDIQAEKRRMKIFRMIGISSYDYERITKSCLSVNEWTQKEERNVFLAGTFGVVTGTSGFFYTRDYGNAALVTFSKAIGAVGMFRTYNKGGEDKNKFWIFTGILSAATIGDVIGSTVAARNRNSRLAKLSAAGIDIGLNINCKNIETYCSVTF